MEQSFTFHVLGGNSRSRAEQSRLAFSMGHHAEVYADLAELLEHPPRSGVIIAQDEMLENGIAALLDKLGDNGVWVPVVAATRDPDVTEIVHAIRQGALDYVALPLDGPELDRIVRHILRDAGRHEEARRRLVEARSRIGSLSRREREVLDWLSEGLSNKAIARTLEISPRTVEIHRANMMLKLGASHAAEAVRMRLEADLQRPDSGEAAP